MWAGGETGTRGSAKDDNPVAWPSSLRCRAKAVVDDGNPEALRGLAPHVDSVHLLTPALACIVPRHVPGTWQALWQDVQYRLVIRQDVVDVVWLGGMPPRVGVRGHAGGPGIFPARPPGATQPPSGRGDGPSVSPITGRGTHAPLSGSRAPWNWHCLTNRGFPTGPVPGRDAWTPAVLCDAFYRTCAVVACAILDNRASADTVDVAMEWISIGGWASIPIPWHRNGVTHRQR